MTMEFTNKLNQCRQCCTTFNGPNSKVLKANLQRGIQASLLSNSFPWIICGDLNGIFSVHDNNSGNPNLEDIQNAQDLARDLNLLEPPLKGYRFTWTDYQETPVLVRLDHFHITTNQLT